MIIFAAGDFTVNQACGSVPDLGTWARVLVQAAGVLASRGEDLAQAVAAAHSWTFGTNGRIFSKDPPNVVYSREFA